MEEKRGYKSVEGVARFLVKRIEDGWLVQKVISIESASGTENYDLDFYFVEDSEGLRVVRLNKGYSDRIEENNSFNGTYFGMMKIGMLKSLIEEAERKLVLKVVANADPEYAKGLAFWRL